MLNLKKYLQLAYKLPDLLTQPYPTASNKVPNKVFYKAVANLYPTKYLGEPCQEYHCVNICIKSRNNDSVVDHSVYSLTIE